MEETLATIGAVALTGAIVGGGMTAAGVSVPVIASLGRQLLLGLVGLALLLTALALHSGWPGGDDRSETGVPGTEGEAGGGGGGAGGGGETETAAPETGTAVDGCTVEVTHAFAEMNVEPGHAAQVVGPVPEGSYAVSSAEVVSWAGRDEQWFELEVDGRTGWILDSPMLLTKSAGCP